MDKYNAMKHIANSRSDSEIIVDQFITSYIEEINLQEQLQANVM